MPGLRTRAVLAALLLLPLAFERAVAEAPRWHSDNPGMQRIILYFFWSEACPHCQEARPFVDGLAREPWLVVESREVSRDRAGRQLFRSVADAAGQTASAVPAFFFCERGWSGFDVPDTTGELLLRDLRHCYQQTWGRPPPGTEPPTAAGTWAAFPSTIRIPLAGDIDLSAFSLPVLTLVMASLDAFNPCAFFVLLFLLSLLTHTRSRRRMLLVGGIFVFVSGLVYFLFMSAWLSLFTLLGSLRWITAAAGILAVTIGLLNIKDFLRPGGSVTLGMNRNARSALFERIRKLLQIESTLPVVGATLLLAVAANSYELLCTAGFPMVYTRILTLEDLSSAGRLGYLVAYSLLYVLPLLAILLAYVYTLGSRKLGAREGRALKLLSGLMMLGLGMVLLLRPGMLNNPLSALLLMGGALVVTVAAHRRLPGRHAEP